jgi:hypothetical protein
MTTNGFLTGKRVIALFFCSTGGAGRFPAHGIAAIGIPKKYANNFHKLDRKSGNITNS